MSEKMPPIGSMRDKLTYEEKTLGTATALGDQPVTWNAIGTAIAARVLSLSGYELFRASQVHSEATVEVTVWYNPLFTPAGRFSAGSRQFYPLSVNSDQQNRFMVCLCKERVGEQVSG